MLTPLPRPSDDVDLDAACPGLRACFEGVGRRLRARVLNRAGVDLPVRVGVITTGTLAEVAARGPEGALWTLWGTADGRPPVLLAAEPALIRALLGHFFGDSAAPVAPRPGSRQLTAVEQRVARRLVAEVLGALAERWPVGAPPAEGDHLTRPSLPAALPTDTRLAWTRLECGAEDEPIGSLVVAIPLARLQAAAAPAASVTAREPRFERVLPVSVELVVELARITLTVARLRELAVGTELPLGPVREAIARVGGAAVLEGEPGSDGGQRSFRVLRRTAYHGPFKPSAGGVEGIRMERRRGSPMENASTLAFLQDFPVEVTVELGRAILTIRELAELGEHDVITLDRPHDRPVDLVAGGRVLARGQTVVVGDRVALRIVEIVGDEPPRRVG